MLSIQTIGDVTLTAGAVPLGGDLETLLLAICTDRVNALNAVARGMAGEIQSNNQKIAQLNDSLNKVRSGAPATDDGNGSVAKQLSSDDVDTLKNFGVDYRSFVNANGSVPASGGYSNLMESVKTRIDTISSTSQLDMIKLQGLINKANQTIEMMTNLVQKFSDTRSKIIGNIH